MVILDGLLLLDTKDLKSMLNFVADNATDYEMEYGKMSKQSLSAIVRAIVALEAEGAEFFFGEPALDIADWLKTDVNGKGQLAFEINLQIVRLVQIVDEAVDDVGLLFREIYQVLEVGGTLGHLAEFIDVAVELGHGESGRLECVDVPVYGSVRHIKLLR